MGNSTRSRSVVLLHVCPVAAARSILRGAVNPDLALGRRSLSWFCSPARRRWAIAHVMARHSVGAVCVLRFRLPRTWLCRFARGVWTCARPVPASLCISVSLPSDGQAA